MPSDGQTTYWCQFLNYLKHFLAFQYCNYTDTPVKSSSTFLIPIINTWTCNMINTKYLSECHHLVWKSGRTEKEHITNVSFLGCVGSYTSHFLCISQTLCYSPKIYNRARPRQDFRAHTNIREFTNIFQMIPQTWNTKQSHVTEAAYFS